MRLGVAVERGEDDGKDDVGIFANEVDDILVVPKVQSSLGNLEVWTRHATGQLLKKRNLNLDEFRRFNDVKDFFHLVQKHHFLRAVDLWPVF